MEADITAEDQLHGWKDIALFLGRTVRTVQRWERRGLPIRRLDAIAGRVYAVKSDLQAWRDGTLEAEPEAIGAPEAPAFVRRLIVDVRPGRYLLTLTLEPADLSVTDDLR